jgi:putative NADPH-quinone reductase/1,4-dihydroxy-2-naphthoate octaprenyltransferase
MDTAVKPAVDEARVGGRAPRVLLIFGHPRRKSLCGALADAYAAAAREAGADLRRLNLASMAFARDVVAPRINDQAMEPDLRAAEEAILWADHLVLVYPTWWGTYPALMKAFLDRILRPGFAFAETGGLTGFEGRLGDRTAHLITTMDTPGPVYRLLYGSPGHNALARATLGFCGIGPVRVTAFGPVRKSDAARRDRWIARAAKEGAALRGAGPGPAWRILGLAGAWLRAVRLQFYPMTWAAYALGAVAAGGADALGATAFWTVYAALFLIEAATVFVNEIVDYESDIRNVNAGPFNGGSRVLADGALSRRALARAALGCFVAAWALAAVAAFLVPAPALPWLAALGMLSVLALCYTLPPVRLSWRTLGELDVALTHGVGVLVVGFLLFGGAPDSALPWLLGAPLALSILPAIALAGLPDRDADAAVGKRTLAVRFGARPAVAIAAVAVVLAAAAAVSVGLRGPVGAAFAPVLVPVLLHGALLVWLLARLHAAPPGPARRIDGILVCALGYMVWFAVGPLLYLL